MCTNHSAQCQVPTCLELRGLDLPQVLPAWLPQPDQAWPPLLSAVLFQELPRCPYSVGTRGFCIGPLAGPLSWHHSLPIGLGCMMSMAWTPIGLHLHGKGPLALADCQAARSSLLPFPSNPAGLF